MSFGIIASGADPEENDNKRRRFPEGFCTESKEIKI
jgi:hypothetical protein